MRRLYFILAFIVLMVAVASIFYHPATHMKIQRNVKIGGTFEAKPVGKRESKRKFDVKILGVEECGTLCRIVRARLVNRDGYAKNVTATLELFVGNDKINVNGKDKLVIPIVDMRPNDSVVKSIRIEVGFFDGLKIRSAGYVIAKLTISWKGGREVIRKKINI